MRKKIFLSTFLVAMLVFLSGSLLIAGVLYSYSAQAQEKNLKSELALAQVAVEKDGQSYLEQLEKSEVRFTLVNADGQVVYDSWKPASEMDNHAGRQEIRQALEEGSGESNRYSQTFTTETLYDAVLLSDGQVLRASMNRETIFSLMLGMLPRILVVTVVALALSALLSARTSRQISGPLNKLDLDHPLENDTYDEIAPLLTKIEQGRQEIAHRKAKLEEKQQEFDAVTENMDEGLVLMNQRHEILSINPAAQIFYNTDHTAVGKNFLVLDRDPATTKLLDEAIANGSAEGIREHNGSEFQFHAGSVKSGGQVIGIALLIFDITERAFAERNRREFTANVSHELKSPLQSIMGSAELIEQGLVKDKDVKKFVGVIYKEAARLVTLIDDIIRLSELDEETQLPTEEVALKRFISAELEPLRTIAAKRRISIIQKGQEIHLVCAKQLLHEVIYNICDNGVKYNKEGGSLTVTTLLVEGRAQVVVKDTGIGIPPEHQARIFERFYRVDKSHSRESGGTGLGLSIVKHATEYLGGKIKLESRVGEGTTITLTLPLEPPTETDHA